MRYLPVWMAASVVGGSLAGISWPGLSHVGFGAVVVGWLVAAAAWRREAPRLVVAAALLALAGVGTVRGAAAFQAEVRPALLSALEDAGLLEDDGPRSPIRFEGRLMADAVRAGDLVRMRIAVDRAWLGPCGCVAHVDGVLFTTVAGLVDAAATDTWRAGRRVRVTGTVRRANAFRNLGAPDAAHDALRRGYGLVASVKSRLLVDVVERGGMLDEAAAALRVRVRRAVSAAADGDATAAALGTAVVIGDRAGIDPTLTARLQRAGTFHVIAISGGNIALVVAVVLAAVRRLTTRRTIGAALAGVAIAGYAGLVGGGASVVRATGMALVGMAALAADLRGPALNVLALTALGLVVAAPLIAVDTGFWLSCAATAGMLVGLPADPGPPWRWRQIAKAAVLASVWAEAALLPLLAAVFQQITLAGLGLNVIAVPGMALVQMAAMAAVILEPVSAWLLGVAGAVLRTGAWLVVGSSSVVDQWPWLAWHVSPPHWAVVALYYVCGGLWLAACQSPSAWAARGRRPTAALAAAAAVWIAVAPLDFLPAAPGELRFTAFDVGQGDALFIEFPNGTRMLVDGGAARAGGLDLGERVVAPALRARGVRAVDLLVVTHADADHIGGTEALVREFGPREVWAGIPVEGHDAIARLHAAVEVAGASWRPVRAGQHVEIGGVDVATLHPPEPDWDRQRVRNDDSVVLSLSWRDVRILLTGDIGSDVERALAVPGGGAPLTVLKVAHHGSAGSSDAEFLARLRPEVAVISVGAENPFGHPTRLVLDRLAAAGADIWRTDRDGEVDVRTDGRRVTVTTLTGRRTAVARQSR